MTTTNYLDPKNFERMISVFRLVTDYNRFKKTNPNGIPDPVELQKLARIEYGCALRVSEALTLTPEDFDFENRILTLNHTKTGYKKCPKCKGSSNDCNKCLGKGKIQRKQFTTIPIELIHEIQDWLKSKPKGEKLFSINRQLVWSYYKKAARFAKINLAEQQDERMIDGAWTHLLRKSRAKWMISKGASEVLVKVKLRHAFTTTERYTRPDINALKEWEDENQC